MLHYGATHEKARIYSLYPWKQNKSIFKRKFVILSRFLTLENFVNLFSFSLEVPKFWDSTVVYFFCLDHNNYMHFSTQKLLFQNRSRGNPILERQGVKEHEKKYILCSDHEKVCYLSWFNLMKGKVLNDCS